MCQRSFRVRIISIIWKMLFFMCLRLPLGIMGNSSYCSTNQMYWHIWRTQGPDVALLGRSTCIQICPLTDDQILNIYCRSMDVQFHRPSDLKKGSGLNSLQTWSELPPTSHGCRDTVCPQTNDRIHIKYFCMCIRNRQMKILYLQNKHSQSGTLTCRCLQSLTAQRTGLSSSNEKHMCSSRRDLLQAHLLLAKHFYPHLNLSVSSLSAGCASCKWMCI